MSVLSASTDRLAHDVYEGGIPLGAHMHLRTELLARHRRKIRQCVVVSFSGGSVLMLCDCERVVGLLLLQHVPAR